ncbi:DapE-ArgE: peptidase, ArgE/DapE family [Rubrobacter radiotolerans]|uniref:Probable succinyl-diaminopimelate desuccinylase n=1 Tax=Rubrobacter radiotolerans TaxID=42256 RepID=A0A023X6V6_RUBRA|nr:DapE-ArgE: peptidase, ArgE/DapE family [Rubrobacter radiotolerans]SMC07734.1 4-acetamidobutyryl-CoA deacetylase [Rubrobacter radiotolerans DSM 5868]
MSGKGLAERVRACVEARREPAVDLLRSLVRVPSVTEDEGAVQRLVEREMVRRGLDVDRWEATEEELAPHADEVGEGLLPKGRPNLLGTRRGTGSGRSLLLNAHVDTVEVGDRDAWSVEPFGGDLVGDALYGRGSCDMKGGLATFLIALDVLDDLGVRLRGDVKLAATVGEEDGGHGALSTVLRGHRADAVVISEPTRLALVPAQGGSLVFRLSVPGLAAHAAARDSGVSAFERFLPLYDALLDLEEERNASLSHPLYAGVENKVPINVGRVRAGNWASTVPESLVAEVRAGLLPGESVGEFKRLLEGRLRAVSEEDDWLAENPPELVYFGGQFSPAEVRSDAPILSALAGAHRAATGRSPAVEGVPYGSDMRHFVRTGGMDCVMYGAGDVRLAHAPDEHVSIAELLAAVATYAHLITDWCGAEGL